VGPWDWENSNRLMIQPQSSQIIKEIIIIKVLYNSMDLFLNKDGKF
jgi:hypothetical protein